MPRQKDTFGFTLIDLAACTGQSKAKVVEQRNKGEFDSSRLESVALYVCKRGQKKLRQAIVNTALGLIVDIPKFKRPKEEAREYATFTYNTLADLTDSEVNTVRQHKNRHRLDPDSFETVMVYLARFSVPRLRRAMVHHAFSEDTLPADVVIPRSSSKD